MLDEMSCSGIDYDRLGRAAPLDRVLNVGWCDCQAGAALLAALCGARQIPARLASGYLLYPAAPGFPTWLEV